MYNLNHPEGLRLQFQASHEQTMKDLLDRIKRFNRDMAETGSKLQAGYRRPPGWDTVYFYLKDGDPQCYAENHMYSCREPAEALARFDSAALQAIIKLMAGAALYELADGTHADPSVRGG